jgi:PAS domain S-box-containing protein
MKLRTILLVLSLLAFSSASIGGYLYYASLREAAYQEAERQAVTRVQLLRRSLSNFLSENIKPVNTLAGMDAFKRFFQFRDAVSAKQTNTLLDHFKRTLQADVCYLMDPNGTTIASSNRDAPDSFVGRNFEFRPYFQNAIQGVPDTYLALGTTSGKRGAYYSHPIFDEATDTILGVVVIKASIELIEKELGPAPNEIVLVIDPRGVIFISNRKEWLYKALWPVSDDDMELIAASRQFGEGPWIWTGLTRLDAKQAMDRNGQRYLVHQIEIDDYPGWHLVNMRRLKDIEQIVAAPLIRITGPIVLALCVSIGFLVFFLYRRASNEIVHRQRIQQALRESEKRYRSIYHHTPAMLHSIDTDGRLVSVSNHWVEALGYQREEVIGKPLTRFFTAQSRTYAEQVVFPEFFRTGYCKDIPYQFVTKDGRVIDILLSAIADRDAAGRIQRTLAVSIDVTERKRAEEALTIAKEELSRYSKDLERQVRKRTGEITSILRYTPAVVYMKDTQGRYLLVNSRYEELFNIRNTDIQGLTDAEVLPEEIARQFRTTDQRVIQEGVSCQVEERIPQEDGMRTYLSVKFPIYGDTGKIRGICGIATDITAVKKAQNQLRRLSGSIMASQEKERAALARELHDELGQVLTALRMDAVWIGERLKEIDAAGGERSEAMCHLIDKTIEEVRNMAIRLRPGVLDTLGLVDALEWYTGEFERHTDMACVFEHNTIPPINDALATAAYRIAQEALTNAARHAEAARVAVRLFSTNGLLELAVHDNGQGFDIRHLSESEGLGVAGMRERAALVGGSLEVTSTPGEGTQVVLRVTVGGGQR